MLRNSNTSESEVSDGQIPHVIHTLYFFKIFASEFVEDLEEMHPQYYMHSGSKRNS